MEFCFVVMRCARPLGRINLLCGASSHPVISWSSMEALEVSDQQDAICLIHAGRLHAFPGKLGLVYVLHPNGAMAVHEQTLGVSLRFKDRSAQVIDTRHDC